VQVVHADKAFVGEVRKLTAPVETRWIAEAKAAGLSDPARVLAEFRSLVSKAN